ncbi:hypothetical protein R5H30_11895 [Sulfitobacter sp. D35]|uniref:hypothetical protein n=1 Tax=Sulfitobacter sp. D35 TaxID=3083252 RepID=UPI00296EA49C|nr:hypothetical protein [Sulfitobacter sp. D35]MDW4498688.1 hypothetical protein [Sulfitobacter sp. D35]
MRHNPREAIGVAQDAVTTAVNAPRRFAFRRQTGQHPVDGIDDARLAVAVIAMAYLELEDVPTQDDLDRLYVLLRSKLRLDEEEANEAQVFGRWVVAQCASPEPAISKLDKRLRKLDGPSAKKALGDIPGELPQLGPSDRQVDVRETIQNSFGT